MYNFLPFFFFVKMFVLCFKKVIDGKLMRGTLLYRSTVQKRERETHTKHRHWKNKNMGEKNKKQLRRRLIHPHDGFGVHPTKR